MRRQVNKRPTFAFQLIIPTVDTAKYYYLMNLFVENSNPFLLLGPPGTGKSVYIKVNYFLRFRKVGTLYHNLR